MITRQVCPRVTGLGSGVHEVPLDGPPGGRVGLAEAVLSHQRRSGPGAHQFQRPSSFMVAGTSRARTTVASMSSATSMPMPIIFMKTMPLMAERPDHDGQQQRGAGDDPAGLLHAGRDGAGRCRGSGPTARGPGRAGTPRSPSTARTGWPASGSGWSRRGSPAARSRAGPDRCPSWKIQVTTPNDAVIETAFISTALIGSTTRAERQEQQHQHHADHDQAHPRQVARRPRRSGRRCRR